MTRTNRAAPARHPRAGLSLIELLVALSVIALLAALAIPAVVRARAAARRTQCQNHLRNLSAAILQFADSKQKFPAAGNFHMVLGGGRYRSWVVDILPWIDQQPLSSQWDFETFHWQAPNVDLGSRPLSVLVCPDDLSAVAGAPNLSYVVNGGFGFTIHPDCPVVFHGQGVTSFDLNGNGATCRAEDRTQVAPSDRELFEQTGLFFLVNWPPGKGTQRAHAPGSVVDGLTQTMMLAESARAGFNPRDPHRTGWSSPNPTTCMFFISGLVCENFTCAAGKVDYARANLHAAPFDAEAINGALLRAEGEAPWASSFHEAGVHVAFCDGRVKFISQSINGGVYAAMASPQGTRIRGPLAQQLVSEADF